MRSILAKQEVREEGEREREIVISTYVRGTVSSAGGNEEYSS